MIIYLHILGSFPFMPNCYQSLGFGDDPPRTKLVKTPAYTTDDNTKRP